MSKPSFFLRSGVFAKVYGVAKSLLDLKEMKKDGLTSISYLSYELYCIILNIIRGS